MSLWYYQDKIPSEYVGTVTAREGANGGYYIGNKKIADLYNSTNEIRNAARDALARTAEDEARDRVIVLNSSINNSIATKTNEANRQLSSVDSVAQRIESMLKRVRNGLSKVGNIKELDETKRKIESKLNTVVNNAASSLQAQRKQLAQVLVEINKLSERQKQARNKDVFEQERELRTVLGSLRGIRIHNEATNIQTITSSLREIEDNIGALQQLFDTFVEVSSKIKYFKSDIGNDYLLRLSHLISNIDIEDRNSVTKACDESRRLYERLGYELSLAREREKNIAEKQKIISAVSSINKARESLVPLDVPEYESDCLEMSSKINAMLDDLTDSKSEIIRKRVMSIKDNISTIAEKDVFDRNDFDELTKYNREIAELHSKNEQYEVYKEGFDKLVSNINECRKVIGEEKTEYILDQENFQEQEKTMMEELRSLERKKTMKMYEFNLASSRDLMLNELKFRKLENQGRANVKETGTNERYTQEVFYSTENPMVVAVVTNMINGEQYIQSRPVCLHIGDDYYFANRNETVSKLVHEVCNKIHKVGNSGEEIELSPNDLDYYLIEGDVAEQYAREMGIIKDEKASKIQVRRSADGDKFASIVNGQMSKCSENAVYANNVANVRNLNMQKERALNVGR